LTGGRAGARAGPAAGGLVPGALPALPPGTRNFCSHIGHWATVPAAPSLMPSSLPQWGHLVRIMIATCLSGPADLASGSRPTDLEFRKFIGNLGPQSLT